MVVQTLSGEDNHNKILGFGDDLHKPVLKALMISLGAIMVLGIIPMPVPMWLRFGLGIAPFAGTYAWIKYFVDGKAPCYVDNIREEITGVSYGKGAVAEIHEIPTKELLPLTTPTLNRGRGM